MTKIFSKKYSANNVYSSLRLAAGAQLSTSPNPSVGCILLTASRNILGQGHTQHAGGPHADIMALRDAAAKGHDVRGVTAYVTLEPLRPPRPHRPVLRRPHRRRHQKIIATNTDPNPLEAGQGFARMRAAGVEVLVLPPDDPLAIASRELNIGFFSRMIRKTPWVRMKMAASPDGVTALPNGASQWITSLEARADGHA